MAGLESLAASPMLAVVAVAFIGGMCVPFKYGIERLRGFGRALFSKLPYKPPEHAPDASSGEADVSTASETTSTPSGAVDSKQSRGET